MTAATALPSKARASNLSISDPSVSDAGDINGDGIDDLIVGAENNEDGSYVVYGSAALGSPNERAIRACSQRRNQSKIVATTHMAR